MPTIEDLCVWNKIMTDPESTTRMDVLDNSHPLYKCLYCKTQYQVKDNVCPNYISETSIINKRLRKEVEILINRYEGVQRKIE